MSNTQRTRQRLTIGQNYEIRIMHDGQFPELTTQEALGKRVQEEFKLHKPACQKKSSRTF